MIKVFVSSPYTKGDMVKNLNDHFKISNKLIDLGFAPFVPLLYHYLEIHQIRDYDVWLDIDLEWLKQSDIMLRLPGESSGAEMEEKIANMSGIPVFYNIEDLLNYSEQQKL
jgi:hypothetical protein